MAQVVAGGYKNFGPTYNSTKWVRFGHEGTINSMHCIDPALIPTGADTKNIDVTDGYKRELAGKIAAYKTVTAEDGTVETYVGLCEAGKEPAGLFVDDLGDALNASNKLSFYFRGGEYYISVARLGDAGANGPSGDGENDETPDPSDEGGEGDDPTPVDPAEAWAGVKAGTPLYAGEGGKLTVNGSGTVVAIVTAPAAKFTTGNMFENAGVAANGGYFVGIQLRV